MCRGVERAGFGGAAATARRRRRGNARRDPRLARGHAALDRVTGPDGSPVEAEWAALADGTAIVEMARASGLALVARNDALSATTYGTGELIAAAIAHGCRRVIVGVGGSATTDGGLGALDALGWTLHGVAVEVACDVTTTFLDAPAIFGPQKGASPADIEAARGAPARPRAAIRRALRRQTSWRCPGRVQRAASPAASRRSAPASSTGSMSLPMRPASRPRSRRARRDHGRGQGRCLDADGQGRWRACSTRRGLPAGRQP